MRRPRCCRGLALSLLVVALGALVLGREAVEAASIGLGRIVSGARARKDSQDQWVGRSSLPDSTAAVIRAPKVATGGGYKRKTPSPGGKSPPLRSLTFLETMLAGAISRSAAQLAVQPLTVLKTLLQARGTSDQLKNLSFKVLTRGAGAQCLLALPHGALNFATLEATKALAGRMMAIPLALVPIVDFLSSTVATLVSSIISTPQMVLTDRLMAGMYENMIDASRKIWAADGLRGFYSGWYPAMMQKIPSYALTWVVFQQLKTAYENVYHRPPNDGDNFGLGATAAAIVVCIMIPLDTVKTRLVTQVSGAGLKPYTGITDCLVTIVREEGIGALYRSLAPRLASVVPMIGIQFGVYEMIKKYIAGESMIGYGAWQEYPAAIGEMMTSMTETAQKTQAMATDFLTQLSLIESEQL